MFYKSRINNLKKQKQLLENTVQERTKQLLNSNNELKAKQEKIQIQNNDLISSEEELQQLNEELSSSNDQLFSQKEELVSTISRLKEMQLQLIESEKMATVGILTSGIAHEINNPLNFIQGGKTALELYIYDNLNKHKKDISPFIKMIDEGIERATKIINGLNRFNSSSEDYNENCDIEAIIENCLLMLQNAIIYNIDVQKEYTENCPNINGNEGELHQVFLNIINNAIQAMEGKGTITIRTLVINEEVVTKISDTGAGISEEDIAKITDPFFTTKAPGKGTGLGMSISNSIIKEHGGNLKFSSEIGKGTTVVVSLKQISKKTN